MQLLFKGGTLYYYMRCLIRDGAEMGVVLNDVSTVTLTMTLFTKEWVLTCLSIITPTVQFGTELGQIVFVCYC